MREGKEVVLAMHSYGGLPGGGAVSGLEKRSCEAMGKKGGVVAMIWMASFVVSKGVALSEMAEKTDWTVIHVSNPVRRLSRRVLRLIGELVHFRGTPRELMGFLSPMARRL